MPLPYTDLPNNDVDEVDYDLEFKKGKKISGSINLMTQRGRIMNDSYNAKAQQNFKKGYFWDHPPTFITKSIPNLKTSWMEFFKLSVFNWYPDLILGDFKPHCPNCKKTLCKNGVKLPPRLVFGQHKNYWLNSPQRFICKDCRDENQARKLRDKGEPKVTYNFYYTSEPILRQIERINPELSNRFPCHVTSKNAIDKGLMNVITHCAVKGIGPDAMADTISSWHELEWQKGENEWARNLNTRVNVQASANQQPIHNRGDIEKCPDYFSLRMGGCVPSGPWLIEMFCILVKRLRPVFDSECLKRAKSSYFLSIDASYKVIKWMMMHGNVEKVYNALISASNEYNEIPMQIFATSDNHDEIRSNLEKLAKLGLNPYLMFSDNPERDESLLKEIFSNLRIGSDSIVGIAEEIPENLTEFTSNKQIMYLYDLDRTCLALSKFRYDLEASIRNTAGPKVMVALDTGESK